MAYGRLTALVVALSEVLLASRRSEILFFRCCRAVALLLKLQCLGLVASRGCSTIRAAGERESCNTGRRKIGRKDLEDGMIIAYQSATLAMVTTIVSFMDWYSRSDRPD
jgi:hypothetical protein